MRRTSDSGDPPDNAARVDVARARLDNAILGFNRHALLVDKYRLAMARYQNAVLAFEAGKSKFEANRRAYDEAALDRAMWHDERAAAALHRDNIYRFVKLYVHELRDQGMAPETALTTVRARLAQCVTQDTPGAPLLEATMLAADLGKWTIEAYYEAA